MQVEGGFFDGQFFHLRMPNYLVQQMDLSAEQFLCTWDRLHKGGVVDTHIREDDKFSWLIEIQRICRDIYSIFNWGKNYDNFLQVCQDLDINMKKLTNFQMTRFVNRVCFIFMNLHDDYLAVWQFLLNVVAFKKSKAEEVKIF